MVLKWENNAKLTPLHHISPKEPHENHEMAGFWFWLYFRKPGLPLRQLPANVRPQRLSTTATKAPHMQKISVASAALLLALSFQATAAEPKEEMTASGIGITMLKEGNGASPKASDTVKVHYRGTLTDGKEFDSSYRRNEPATFPLNRVIPCWTEGVQKIKVGGKAKLVCPSNLAYGSRGVPGIPPNSTLIFEVELLDIAK